MEIDSLQEDEVEAFIDELWLPAQREMAAISEYTLADEIREDGLAYRRNRLSDDDSITYLARRGHQLVGYVTVEIQTPPPIFQQVRECHIDELFVREDARRQGVASELLGTVENWARTHDCENLELTVNRKNRAAKALYETEGYDTKRYKMKKQVDTDR